MGVLAWIVVGFLAGWIAAKLTNTRHGVSRPSGGDRIALSS
jgi:uncharacterized membrane protein YeaQ/YmgE (transglycosylase-associated protein family)